MKFLTIAALAAIPFATQAMDAKTTESVKQAAEVKAEQKVQTAKRTISKNQRS